MYSPAHVADLHVTVGIGLGLLHCVCRAGSTWELSKNPQININRDNKTGLCATPLDSGSLVKHTICLYYERTRSLKRTRWKYLLMWEGNRGVVLHGRNKSQNDTVWSDPVLKKMHSLQIVKRFLLGRNLGVGGVGEMKGRLPF